MCRYSINTEQFVQILLNEPIRVGYRNAQDRIGIASANRCSYRIFQCRIVQFGRRDHSVFSSGSVQLGGGVGIEGIVSAGDRKSALYGAFALDRELHLVIAAFELAQLV